LAPAAIERTLAALRSYAADITKHGVDRVDVVGTSAMRDAGTGGADDSSDGRGFIERAAEIVGIAPRVVSGEEEARLTFSGGVMGLGLEGDVLAFDVGGGSTELIDGSVRGADVEIVARRSLDVGSV